MNSPYTVHGDGLLSQLANQASNFQLRTPALPQHLARDCAGIVDLQRGAEIASGQIEIADNGDFKRRDFGPPQAVMDGGFATAHADFVSLAFEAIVAMRDSAALRHRFPPTAQISQPGHACRARELRFYCPGSAAANMIGGS
ncbi:MAG: hypothetical protein JNL19_11380 [Burkholderiales bacterium]|nr:hypothetical protein [Burkholderiales bacterium]